MEEYKEIEQIKNRLLELAPLRGTLQDFYRFLDYDNNFIVSSAIDELEEEGKARFQDWVAAYDTDGTPLLLARYIISK